MRVELLAPLLLLALPAQAADPDAAIPSGGGIRFDVTNTPNPATDTHTICIAYMSTRQ